MTAGLGPQPVAPTSQVASQISSQIATSSNTLFQGATQNISTGIGNAIAERFFGGGGGSPFSFSGTGTSVTGYTSTTGFANYRREQRRARFELSDPSTQDEEGLSSLDAANQLAGEDMAPEDMAQDEGNSLLDSSALGFIPRNESAAALTEPASASVNVWGRGTFTHYDGDAFSGNTWNGVVGLDYLLTDSLLVGVLGGYESGDFNFGTTANTFDGSGFTFGTYVASQLFDNIVMDTFLTYTWLDYDTSVGVARGSTDATRFMISTNLSGQFDIGHGFILEPNVQAFYAHERQDSYVLSDGTVVAENSIDSGRLSVGPRLRYLVAEDWTAFISAHGEYDLSSESQTNTSLPDFDGLLSARLGLGVDGTFANGWALSLAGDIGGIGSGDFLSYTGTGKIRIPLN